MGVGVGRGDRSKKGWKNRLGEPGEPKGSGRRHWGGGSPRFPRPTPLTKPGGRPGRSWEDVCYAPCIAPRAQGPISATHSSSLSVAAAPQAQSLGHPGLRKGGCGQLG